MVERRVRERRTRAIRELLHGPVLERRLLVVEEDSAILDRRAAV